MPQILKVTTEEEALLVLSWISDSCDIELANSIKESRLIENTNQLIGLIPQKPQEIKRKKRLELIQKIDQIQQTLQNLGITFISKINSNYPPRLKDLGKIAPYGLYVYGDLNTFEQRSLAVVGTRKSNAQGNMLAGEISFDLASKNIVIISGGAIGIDTASHHGALNAGGKTITVQANGLNKLYPSKNDYLFSKIKECGLIVSEYPPGRAPTKNSFLERNRLIASLSDATLVVQAPEISGALSTARYATKLGRPLMAFPGEVGDKSSEGTNELIRTREAESVLNVNHILEILLPIGEFSNQ
jgi:DNA processing protein